MAIEKLTLYHFPASRSARAMWALHETVGNRFEVKKVALYQGEQFAGAFLEKNPNHNVPVLEITLSDGTVHQMLESAAMVQWLVDAHPEKQLAPAASELSLQRADYLQMLHFGASWMDMMLWQIRIHEHVLPPSEADERTIARYRKKFASEVEPQLLQRLQKWQFICGDKFSGADIVIGHNVTWARGYRMCQDDLFRGYLSRLSKRPAFQQAFADAREFTPEVSGREKNTKFSG